MNWKIIRKKWDTLKSWTERINSIISRLFQHFCKKWTKTTCNKWRKYWLQKAVSRDFFFYGFGFLKKYGISYILLKNLVANTININTVNDDQRNFVFHLMKGYNVSSFFKTIEIKDS